MTTILLGPQRFTTTVTPALRSLDADGPVAVINAGWEEREGDDGELDGLLDGRGRNLRLYERTFEVLAEDERFAAAGLAFRDRQDELRAFYGIRLRAAMDAVAEVLHRSSPHGLRGTAVEAAIAAVRDVDTWYAGQLKELYREVDAAAPPEQSEPIARHRSEIDAVLQECCAVVLPGGHVGSLVRALRLFRVRIPAHLPVIAWSAGAMALTERVVLFHDFGPHGASFPEVYDRGLARLPGIAVFPHAKRRLRLDDPEALQVLARRFADLRLLLLDTGTFLRFEAGGQGLPDGARVITDEGRVAQVGA
ncbi:MAG TPA: hypothetical protein VFJ94_11605 [Intrasporangium sp.]|uniref:hypothetical protein n=1 Tax=Intrasporangium sp. TaxID=1925024 RepID=UPI002D79EE3C|nr:hypothetical protein [Intrasporangium sp.]HET7399153.1 hypothetical protein [Intrasporangium sp.]